MDRVAAYAAGIDAFLVVVGGWQMFRAQRTEVEEVSKAPAAVAASPAASGSPSIADRLRTLDQLKTDGLITYAEHSERRAALLEQV